MRMVDMAVGEVVTTTQVANGDGGCFVHSETITLYTITTYLEHEVKHFEIR